jgi:hypothetical protein
MGGQIMSEYMNDADKLLKAALLTTGKPVARLVYDGTASEYLTFQTIYSEPILFRDDDNAAYLHSYRVDVYSKENYKALLQAVTAAIRAAGFSLDGVNAEIFEEDTSFYHVPINISILKEC